MAANRFSIRVFGHALHIAKILLTEIMPIGIILDMMLGTVLKRPATPPFRLLGQHGLNCLSRAPHHQSPFRTDSFSFITENINTVTPQIA